MNSKAHAYHVDTGHARFRTECFGNGNVQVQVYCSDKKVPIGVDLSRDELWKDQTITPVFALHCDSIEQLEAYKVAFESCIETVKKYFACLDINKETKE